MFKCRVCGGEFSIPAWVDIIMQYSVPPLFTPQNIRTKNGTTQFLIEYSYLENFKVTTTVKKPVCPFCFSDEIESE